MRVRYRDKCHGIVFLIVCNRWLRNTPADSNGLSGRWENFANTCERPRYVRNEQFEKGSECVTEAFRSKQHNKSPRIATAIAHTRMHSDDIWSVRKTDDCMGYVPVNYAGRYSRIRSPRYRVAELKTLGRWNHCSHWENDEEG